MAPNSEFVVGTTISAPSPPMGGGVEQDIETGGSNMDMTHKCSTSWDEEPRPESNRQHRATRLRNKNEEEQDELTKKESKGIFRLRVLVLLILLFTTIAVSIVVFVITKHGETEEFHNQYEGAAAKITTSFQDIVYEMASVSGLGVASSAHSVDHKSDWPFVTLSSFQQRAGNAMELSGALMVSISPLVRQTQFQRWEDYVSDPVNHYWISEGHEFQQVLGLDDFEYQPNVDRSILNENATVDPMHYHDSAGYPHVETEPLEEYLPTWQTSPVLKTRLVNQNVYHEAATTTTMLSNNTNDGVSAIGNESEQIRNHMMISPETFATVFYKESAIVGGFDMAPPGTVKHEDPTTALFATLMSFAAKEEVPYLGDPMANIYIPVFDLFDNASRSAVAVMTSTIHWRKYFAKILPPNVKGIVVVLENTCDGFYTYSISGGEASAVGLGDRHDTKFDEYEKLGSFDTTKLQDGTAEGITLDQGGCHYKLHVYPSQEFYDTYNTPFPLIITWSIVAVFLFTIAIFLIYDRLVEQRQKIIMDAVAKSTVNVSILEEKVLERTQRLETSNNRLEKANRAVTIASAKQLQHFACMSHEIRTPLNCIIGMSSLFYGENLPPKVKEALGMIVTSGDLLLRVVNDVLDYSKLESGKVEIDVQRCNLQETLDAVVRSIETNAMSKNITIRTYYGASVEKFLQTDSRRLQQILYNLLGNAIKFSREDEIVELFVDHNYADDEKVLRIIVKDYGKGIEKKDFKKIFEPFLQASTETERIYGGSGLGLAISAKIVKTLGGRISVDSELGHWTAMKIDFPCLNNIPSADVVHLSSRLKGASLFLVGAKAEEASQVADTFKQYSADLVSLCTTQELENAVQSLPKPNHVVCLISEDLYDDALCQGIASSREAKVVFVTFGPKFSVKESHGHYRSIPRVLPSSLMKTLGDHLQTSSLEVSSSKPAEGKKAAAAVPYQDLRVLIAEDNLVNQKVAVRVLNRIGVNDIQVVGNGKLAVEKEALEQFDIVLMDMQMPVMDGIDACRLITDRHQREGILDGARVVFVTAHVLESFKAECYTAGGAGFLAKPFRIEDLKICLQQLEQTERSSSTQTPDL